MLKALHTHKGILTDEECAECASKERSWHKLAAIVVATKPPDVVRQTLVVVWKQSGIVRDPYLETLAKLLKGKPTVRTTMDT